MVLEFDARLTGHDAFDSGQLFPTGVESRCGDEHGAVGLVATQEDVEGAGASIV